MTKAQIVRAAIASGEFEGDLEICDRRGAYFRLRPTRSTVAGLGIDTFNGKGPLVVVEVVDVTQYKTNEDGGHLQPPARTSPDWSPATCSDADTFVDSIHDAKDARYAKDKANDDDNYLRPSHTNPGWSPAACSEAETFVGSIDNEKKEAAQCEAEVIDHRLEPVAPKVAHHPEERRPSIARRTLRQMRRLLMSCFGVQTGAHREYPKFEDGEFY
jgi:hypothetical protein